MAIATKLKSLAPSRESCRREITLLSRGYYNKTAFPGGKIIVYPWDSYADDILLSANEGESRLKTLFSLIPRLCDLNSCPVSSMLAGDAMLVLYVARSFRRDCILGLTVKRASGASVEVKVRIPDDLSRVGEKEADYTGYDDVTLPDAGDVVSIRPLTIGDELTVERMRSSPEYGKHPAAVLRAVTAIKSVGGGEPTNPEEAIQYWNALKVSDQRFLTDMIETLSPHVSDVINMVDDTTGEQLQTKIDIGYEFFR